MVSQTIILIITFLIGFFIAKNFYQKRYKKKYAQVHMDTLNCVQFPAPKDPLQAITIATQVTPPAQRMFASMNKNNLSLTVLGLGCKWQGFGNKTLWLREYLEKQKASDGSIVLLVDAYDTLCLADQTEIIEKFISQKSNMVFSAEKQCWPSPEAAVHYPESETDFRFLNAGCAIGYRGAILETIQKFNISPIDNDQEVWTNFFLRNQDSIKLDYRCDIFLNLFGVSKDEFKIVKDDQTRLILENYYSKPCILHGNGPSGEMLDEIASRLKFN